MDTYNLIAIVTTLTALLAFLNARFLKLPAAIGIMMLALVLSLALMLSRFLVATAASPAADGRRYVRKTRAQHSSRRAHQPSACAPSLA